MSQTEEEGLPKKLAELADRVANDHDADVILFSGPIDEPYDRRLLTVCSKRKRRKNVVLLLVTYGGDPDAAFRMARCLQSKYENFTILVTGNCKSAGTLIALGANELVMSDAGELGPLDVQMAKQDSLWDSQSGLTVNAALLALQSKAYLAFEQFFLETENRSQGLITVKTASEIATQMTVGLFSPLYAQVDPIHVGEAARAMAVAEHYGRILIERGGNTDPAALSHLVTHYPSHGFVIDREEASTIFKNVRAPSESEEMLADALGEVAIRPQRQNTIQFLSSEMQPASVAEGEVVPAAKEEGIADLKLTEEQDAEGPADSRSAAPRSAQTSGTQSSNGPRAH